MLASPCHVTLRVSCLVLVLLGYLVASTPQPVEAKRRPTIRESVSALTFTAMEGGSNPKSQTFTISKTGGGGTLSWSVSENAAWLNLSPTSGTITTEADIITVSADVTGLSTNTYTSTIIVTTPGATTASQQIPVTLTLSAPSPTFGQSPGNLAFFGTQGGANPTTQTSASRMLGKAH